MGGIKEKLLNELKKVGLVFIASVVVFQIVFFRENFFVNLRVVGAFFWLFVLPGFMVMYYWHKQLGILQRLIIGTATGIALTGITSYYTSLIGLHIKHHTLIIPAIIISVCLLLIWKKKKS